MIEPSHERPAGSPLRHATTDLIPRNIEQFSTLSSASLALLEHFAKLPEPISTLAVPGGRALLKLFGVPSRTNR